MTPNDIETDRVILVTGATGQQGGAVARDLLGRGFHVRALTRDPTQPKARNLSDEGAELVQGDFDDRSSLDRALEGVSGVFSVQNFMQAGLNGEVRQGRAIADAARDTGVDHFVYSSVGGAERETGIPHFESKWEVEKHVRDLDLPYTILRPVFFMQNWEFMARESVLDGTFAQPLDPSTSLQQIDVADVGVFAGKAFSDHGEWLGREVELAGDEMTMNEVADTFARVTGGPVQYRRTPHMEFREQAGEEMTLMYDWFEDVGYNADIDALRDEHAGLTRLEDYLRANGWENTARTA